MDFVHGTPQLTGSRAGRILTANVSSRRSKTLLFTAARSAYLVLV
jgi:hypothetical protein